MNTDPGSTPAIPGYCLHEQLYCSFKTVIYRAVRACDQSPVVIKVLRPECAALNHLFQVWKQQIRNHYAIARTIHHTGIIHPYHLEPFRNSHALVMEHFDSISLTQFTQERSLSLTEQLEIALQLADILDGLYQHQIIHKNIQPSNILIHPETRQVKLTDFSLASRLPKEMGEIQNPNLLEGTLAYLSPEQTGRMNRGIDYRTDFYALGVTLYELFTGQLPFQAEDPLELVYCHIARQSIPPYQIARQPAAQPGDRPTQSQIPTLPKPISDIVLKLMAKNAEDRYQSALGLKHDLVTCLHQFRITRHIVPFEIGTQDISHRFLIPEKLYGREPQVAELLAAFERVAGNRATSPQENNTEALPHVPLPSC
jgi:protein kinase